MEWIEYEQEKWDEQELPPARRLVLVQVDEREIETMELPPTVAVGWLKYAAGDKRSPMFIVPGVGGPAVAWSDCLGDDFHAPLWKATNKDR